MNYTTIARLLIAIGIYIFIRFFGGWIGELVMYPVTLMVTYIHEFGHAIGSIVSGGGVCSMNINKDGTGFVDAAGGNVGVTLFGGYLGSILIGNLMLFLSVRFPRVSQFTLKFIGFSMAFTSIIWFSNIQTTVILIIFAAALYFICEKTNAHSELLMFLGLVSILYILQDFKMGETSDLKKYAELYIMNSPQAWMVIWSLITLAFTFFNLRYLVRRGVVVTTKTAKAKNEDVPPSAMNDQNTANYK